MANTYTQVYVHIVFAVKGRQNLIRPDWKEELQKYISGIVRNGKQKMVAINCMPDHVHMLVSLKTDMALADLVRDVKANSSRLIDEKGWIRGRFCWQEGFGAFSRSQEELARVVSYIQNQEQHHAKRAFVDEYLEMLTEFQVEFDKRYIFTRTD